MISYERKTPVTLQKSYLINCTSKMRLLLVFDHNAKLKTSKMYDV